MNCAAADAGIASIAAKRNTRHMLGSPDPHDVQTIAFALRRITQQPPFGSPHSTISLNGATFIDQSLISARKKSLTLCRIKKDTPPNTPTTPTAKKYHKPTTDFILSAFEKHNVVVKLYRLE